MADSSKGGTTSYKGNQFSGWKGSQAGKNFPSSDEVSEDKDWQDYKKEKKLSFAASKLQHKDEFSKWRKGRQKKPSPAPTSEPIVKTGL